MTEKLAKEYKPRFILIEDKASGQQLIQDIGFLGDNIRVIGIKPRLDKVTRFAPIVPLFQAGSVLIPRQSSIILKELGRTSILQMWILKGYTFNKSSDDFIMNIQ
ncbi:hypothetical protein [Rickettsia endosymbiont of Cantharis rufa]|uniref:hypothetical protein n=1 Tax=Rickettsia endosymbiont of Cantharis rufa TaxID=3066248 RepID=UPI003132D5D3